MRKLALLLAVLSPVSLLADEPANPAERGRIALTTRTFTPSAWTPKGYENVWKLWQPALKEAPADHDQAFREHYGLHPSPYKNGRLPMGLREAVSFLRGQTITVDCMVCHGGSIFGKSYIGLGNTALDLQSLYEDLNKASGYFGKTPFTFANVRGTVEAGNMLAFLMSFREPTLSLRVPRHQFVLHDNLCEDTPAWWHLKKKKTMYYTGSTSTRSVRALMQFMLVPTNTAATFDKEEAIFKDIQAFLMTLQAPKYPFPINKDLFATGEKIFAKTCARCHGTYGPNWSYPNKIVDLDVIGTDPTRFHGLDPKVGELYNRSWFAKEKANECESMLTAGYQAPPLDGVWATAPYLHNGAVPTLYDMLNSKGRPKIFTRSYKTGVEDYDQDKVGWKVRALDKAPDPPLSSFEMRKIYDTTQPGRGNQGHTFGDNLNEDQRRAVIEYLKTL